MKDLYIYRDERLFRAFCLQSMFAGAAGLIYADEPCADLCRLIPSERLWSKYLGSKVSIRWTQCKNVQRALWSGYFLHFCLEWHKNMVPMIVLLSKCAVKASFMLFLSPSAAACLLKGCLITLVHCVSVSCCLSNCYWICEVDKFWVWWEFI